MSNGVFLRYFCHVTSHTGEGRNGDIGFEYFQSMKEAGYDIRVVAINMASLHPKRLVCEVCGPKPVKKCEFCKGKGFISHPSRWSPFNEEFIRAIPKQYVNVVCGDSSELTRLFTVGTKNVAIFSTKEGAPTNKEIMSLKEYDSVVCPREKDVKVLRLLGVERVVHVTPSKLTDVLRGTL